MDRMVAFCGVVCSDCTAYIATQDNNSAAKERVAALWREAFNSPDIDAASITCDGCLTVDGRLSGYCSLCKIRACGVARGVVNCAHCSDYACEMLERFFERMEDFFGKHEGFLVHESNARAVLDEIHRSLYRTNTDRGCA
jgi:hypothetical protein